MMMDCETKDSESIAAFFERFAAEKPKGSSE